MLKLILPILFPSWRFFSSIDASPRVQFGFLMDDEVEPKEWFYFRSIPIQLGVTELFKRLFINSQWNEKLYINTCAEHLFDSYSYMREEEIARRLLSAINENQFSDMKDANFFVYRLCAVQREGNELKQGIVFVSKPVALNRVSA